MVVNCDKNNNHIKFWLLNNYKIKLMIEFCDQFVRNSSVSLSFTLSRNEKVEQHIRKKTHKCNALRFWVEGGVIPLCGSGSDLILVCLPSVFPLDFANKWYQS